MMTVIFSTFSIITFSLFLLNSTLYPTLTVKYLGLSSVQILFFFSIITLTLALFNRVFLPSNFVKKNTKIIFPAIALFNTLLVILERTQYTNFVLRYFHIFPYSLIYVSLFCGIIYYVSLYKTGKYIHKFLLNFFLLSVILFGFLQVRHNDTFTNLVKEDSILEYSQFIFLLLSAIYSYKLHSVFKNNKKNRLYSFLFLCFSILVFFVAFEEISWGQRIFNFKTPETIKNINIQEETNVHNIASYRATQIVYILVAMYCSFSRIFVDKFLPKKFKYLVIFTPQYYLIPYFIIVAFAYFDKSFLHLYYDLTIYKRLTLQPWLEVSELYLAIGLFGYSFFTYKDNLKKTTVSL